MTVASLGINENIEDPGNHAKPLVGPPVPVGLDKGILSNNEMALHASIQTLVADGKLKEAEEKIAIALKRDSKNESVLVLASLVSMADQRWEDAVSRLMKLREIQGDQAPAMTHLMMIRALRCLDKHLEAMEAAMIAVRSHYDNQEIVEEAASVAEYLNEWESAVLALDVLVEMHGDDVPKELITRWDTAKLMAMAFGMTDKAEFTIPGGEAK